MLATLVRTPRTSRQRETIEALFPSIPLTSVRSLLRPRAERAAFRHCFPELP